MNVYYLQYRLVSWWRRNAALRLDLRRFGSVYVHPQFKLEDVWIGLYWRVQRNNFHDNDDIYRVEAWLCLLPCLPIHATWTRWEDEVPF